MAKDTVTISFKPFDEKDQQLKEWIKNHSGYSAFIKDILRKVMEREISGGDPNELFEAPNYSRVKKEPENETLLDLTAF